MPSWKKVILSGSTPNFANVKIDGLPSNTVILGGGSGSALITQARNGTGNILGTAGANGVNITGSFTGSFDGVVTGTIDSSSVSLLSSTASVAIRANTLSPAATASISDISTLSRGGSGSFSGSFQGDGASLTGIATNLAFGATDGSNSSVNLKTQVFEINGTSQEITTTVSGQSVIISLPDDVTIGDDLTVTGDATVGGDLIVGGAIVSASSLEISDQFIILASGSNGAIDGGIIINQVNDSPDGKGSALAFDSSVNRWALETGLNDTASVIVPDAYLGVIQESGSVPGTSTPTYGGSAGKGTLFIDTSANDVYIYV
tara:strand:- start:1208 stop:2161 length:954 start_codon:yes stop_codon:yes gene_type:complete